jgi:hypothetical protein
MIVLDELKDQKFREEIVAEASLEMFGDARRTRMIRCYGGQVGGSEVAGLRRLGPVRVVHKVELGALEQVVTLIERSA